MIDWVTVAVSVASSGSVSTGLFALLNGRLERKLTGRVEEAKDATAQRLKQVDALIAEADRKSALALRRDDSRMTALIQVNRLAADAEALAHNATVDQLPDGTPIYPLQAYANSGKPTDEAASEAARLESDAYFFSPDLGRAVTRLREAEENLRWAATEIRSPLDPFDGDDPLVTKLRAASVEVRAQVQTMLHTWES